MVNIPEMTYYQDDIVSQVSSTASTITTTATDLASGNFVGIAQTALSFVGIDPIGGINDIISNGFNLSCYNASYPPSETAQMIKTKNQPQVQQLLNNIYGATNIVDLEKHINIYSITIYNNLQFYKDLLRAKDWSSCSRDGLKLFVDFYAKLVDNFASVLNSLTQNYNVVKTDVASKTVFPQGGVYWATQSEHDDKPFTFVQIKLIKISSDPQNPTSDPIVITDPITGQPRVVDNTNSSGGGGGFPWLLLAGLFLF